MTERRAPRVSVVMAVRNGERYLAHAIESILSQRLADLELVVIDDGSTDRSAAIVAGFGDARVRLLSNGSRAGLATSLNRGVSAARGQLVARLDADDVAAPERLARQVEFLDAHSHVALVGSWYIEIDAEGRDRARHRLPIEHWDLRWHLCLYSPFVHSAVMWRRELVADRVGAYDERLAYSMDFDLWRRIANTLPVANVPEYLVRVRSHPGSMTATYGEPTREGMRLRALYAARLLGWTAAAEAASLRLDRLYRLLASTPRESFGSQWLRDARELLRLHAAFVAAEGVPPQVAARQRHAIVAGIVRRLGRALLPGPARPAA